MQTIRDHHTRPVDCAAWRWRFASDDDEIASIIVWTGDSMGIIKQWLVEGRQLTSIANLAGHHTSITRLVVSEEGLWSGTQITCFWKWLTNLVSMDKTAILHPFDASVPFVISHPSSVKSILPIPIPISGQSFVLSGSEDEDIRVWNVSNMPQYPARLVSTVSGHCGEVSAMKWWQEKGSDDEHPSWVLVSASLDGTLRRWTLQGEHRQMRNGN